MDDENIMSPEDRLKQISDVGNSVELNFDIPARRYFKSGLEMVRMANVYYDEGNLENAYTLYMRFMIIFIEKIRSHPEYSSLPPEVRTVNSQKLREVLPKAEKLKAQLRQQYEKDYSKHLKEKERRAEEERLRQQRAAADEAEKKETKVAARQSGGLKRGAPPVDGWSLAKSVTPVPPLPADLLYPSDALTGTGIVQPPSQPIPSSGAVKDGRPGVDRSKKPSLLSAMHSSKQALRPVVVPSSLTHKFLSIASTNTRNNIETCGILGGVLLNNKLVVTHLLVPLQTGKSDACMTQKEEQIFDYQDQNELVTFGWIHTHPTQTAFLSSVDLHTHCSYQLLMPEAIAVVCAPKYKDNQFFCLTPSYGVDYIASCRQTGFHPHPSEPPLFMVAEHVKVVEGASLEVVDFRNR